MGHRYDGACECHVCVPYPTSVKTLSTQTMDGILDALTVTDVSPTEIKDIMSHIGRAMRGYHRIKKELLASESNNQ